MPAVGLGQRVQRLIEAARSHEETTVHHDAAFQTTAQPVGDYRRPGFRLIQIGGNRRGAADGQSAVCIADPVGENAELAQKLHVLFAQTSRDHAPFQQRPHGLLIHRLGDRPFIQQTLQRDAVIDPPFEDATLIQIHEAVDEHLAGAIQPLGERLDAANLSDQFAVMLPHPQLGQHLLIKGVLLVPQLAEIDDGVAQTADADLQGAAIADQGAGVQTQHVVGVVHGHVGRPELPEVVTGMIEHQIEGGRPDHGVVVHKGHFAVNLGEKKHLPALAAQLLDHRKKIQSHFGIATQTQPPFAIHFARGDLLRPDVHSVVERISNHMGVVSADVILLRYRHIHEAARFEEKLHDLDIGRHPASAQVECIFQIRVIAKHPLDERLQKPLFQIAGTLGNFNGDRREDLQIQVRIHLHPPVERIHQRIGLTDPQGDAEYDSLAHPGDDFIHTAFDILKIKRAWLWHDPISLGRLIDKLEL